MIEDYTYCCYDIDGNKITIKQWSDWREKNDNHLADNCKNGYRISTVLLGIDHNWSREGKPIIFETMVFSNDWKGVYMERYATKKEALEGHKRIVENIEDYI